MAGPGNIFCFFSFVILFYGITSVRSIGKPDGYELITVKQGESVTLHCNFSTDAIQELSTLVVHWSKDGVTKYFSNTTCCNFQGFEISNQDLQEGRAPLKLVNVQEKDTGVYTCSIKYKTIEESLNTILQVQDDSDPRRRQMVPAERTLENDDPVVPEFSQPHRALKIGLVSGALAFAGLLAIFLYFCYEG